MRVTCFVLLFAVLISSVSCSKEKREPSLYEQKLLSLKEQTGRDNAMIYYEQARQLVPAMPTDEQKELIDEILDEQWSDRRANDLENYLVTWEPAFNLIEKGVRIENAEGLDIRSDITEQWHDLSFGMTAVKLLVIRASLLDSEGKPSEALDELLTAAEMAADYGHPEGTLVGHLVSIHCLEVASRGLSQFVHSNEPSASDAEKALATLKEIEDGRAGLADAFDTERFVMKSILEQLRNLLQVTTDPGEIEEFGKTFFGESDLSKKEVFERFNKVIRDWDSYWSGVIELSSKPFVAVEPRRLEPDSAAAIEVLNIRIPNYLEARLHETTMLAYLRMAQIDSMIALYRREHGTLPEALEELPGEVPLDPFTSVPFHYQPGNDGNSYRLFSPGPDQRPDADSRIYDPTNGTLSPGDIFSGR